MQPVRVVELGLVPPVTSQAVYHALAYTLEEETPDTILLVSTTEPYVSIGYHQDPLAVVDLDYCKAEGLPVIRREVGGGAVYLDSGQVFCQWVFHPDRLPQKVEECFTLYIRPFVETYRALGIPAQHRPINDIHVRGKKIGGTGAARIGQAQVMAGSLMFTFDKARMARVLKVSSEKMRDKVYESLQAYMTTLEEELGTVPPREEVVSLYLEKCREVLGVPLERGQLTSEEWEAVRQLEPRFLSEEWLFLRGGLREPAVKIHEDVYVAEAEYKAPGGLIRVVARIHRNRIEDVSITGDFTLLPGVGLSALESALRGIEVQPHALRQRIQEVYRALALESPGVAPEDFCEAVLRVRSGR